MSASRTPEGLLTEKGKERLWTGIWRVGVSIIGMIGTGAICLLLKDASTYGHVFVSNTPAVVEARATAVEAKAAADVLSSKVDTLGKTLGEALPQILSSIKQSRVDTQSILVSSSATNQHLADMDGRLARLEAKQDSGK